MKLYSINGPNLNMLGIREPEKYGSGSYNQLCALVKEHCEKNGAEAIFYQSNHEGCIVDKIQEAYYDGADGIVINPAAYTHTSIAILDALLSVKLPFVEVHISKIEEREAFRQTSYIRSHALATITGKGFQGYIEACDILIGDKK